MSGSPAYPVHLDAGPGTPKWKSLSHVRLFVTPWTNLSGFSVHGDSPGKDTGLSCPPLWDLANPGIEPRSPTLQADSLPAEPPGKPKNTGVNSLSLLQGIFPTQELNRGLLHCRWISYQLSYQESPCCCILIAKHRVWPY